MTEKALWKLLKPYLPQGHYVRVENADAGPGTPDVNYRIKKIEGWIELKNEPGTPTVPFPDKKKGLHQSQLDWIEARLAFGGKVLIVARVGPEIFFLPGKVFRHFNGASRFDLRMISYLVAPYINIGSKIKIIKRILEKDP